FFSSRRRHTRCYRDWSSDVCSSDLIACGPWTAAAQTPELTQVSALIRQGHFDLAEKRLQHLLSQHPHSAKALNLLGVVYLRQARSEERRVGKECREQWVR